MTHRILLVLLTVCAGARAELPYKLPRGAKYNVSDETIAKAKTFLTTNLVGDASVLTNLFAPPMMCGPGLWDILKSSDHFSKPPIAKTTVRVPLPGGKLQELPLALLQTEDEVAVFRKAIAELIRSQGKLTIREPNKDEFMVYWTVIPYDKIDGAVLVAEGKDCTIFCQFSKEKGRVFWADEVKRMHFKKKTDP